MLNFSNDFESIINKWYDKQSMLWKKSKETPHIDKKRLNINGIIWLLGKENVALNSDKEHIKINEINETPDHKTKSGDAKETTECNSHKDENPETSKEGEDGFEYPETFMGLNLNMFKSEMKSKINEKSRIGQTMSEALTDIIYETERQKGRRKGNNHDKPIYIDDVPDFFDDMGTIMFPGMDANIKEGFGEKERPKKNKCNKSKNNNVNYLDDLGNEELSKSESKDKRSIKEDKEKLDTKINEASEASRQKNPKYINVEEYDKGTVDMIGDFLNEAKELKMKLGDLGPSQFQGFNIPILEDVFKDSGDETKIQERSKEGKSQEGDQVPETNQRRTVKKGNEEKLTSTLEDKENYNHEEL